MYSMTPINNGTRLRKDHSTFAEVITSFLISDVLSGSELWIAPADGLEVRAGDKWLKVTHKNGVPLDTVGWTAYIHKSLPVCKNFKEVGTEVPPVSTFPESFTLTDPSGKQAEYIFVREL